jgi:hypothetical protein
MGATARPGGATNRKGTGMGTQDRRWWINGVMALFWVGLAGALALWYLRFMWPYDVVLGFQGQVDAVLALLSFLILLGMSASALLNVTASRQREAQRQHTIERLPSAMLEVDWPLGAPDDRPVPAEITVEWPDSLGARIQSVINFVFFAAGGIYVYATIGATVLNFILLVAGIHWAPLQELARAAATSSRRASANRDLPPLAPIFSLAALLLALLAIGTRALVNSVPRLVRISAEQTGLTARMRWGRHIHMLWQELRLIELQHTPRVRDPATHQWTSTVHIEVRDDRHLITWKVTSKEARERLARHADLIALLERYSGRTAHAFDSDDPARAVGVRQDLLAQRLHIVFFGVVTTSSGVVSALFDSYPVVWIVFTATTCGTAIWLLWRTGKGNVPFAYPVTSPPAAPAFPDEIAEPSWQPDPQALYEMTVGSYGLFRTTQGLCVVVGLSAAAIGVGVALDGIATVHSHIWWGSIGALIGVIIAVVSLRARDTVVIAQHDGLRKRWLLADTLIPWHDIASITRRGTWYTVRGRAARQRIAWPTVPFDPARTPQEPGAILINPLQMAEVVERRTGLTVQAARPM